jgi:hypothetical protein
MTQGQWKHVPILWKLWYCFYTRYFVLTFNYHILIIIFFNYLINYHILIALSGGIVLEQAVDLSSDRLLMNEYLLTDTSKDARTV